MAKQHQAVAVKDDTKTALTVADDTIFEGDTTGSENITGKDLVIPRINILQALSPELNKNKPKYIAGAEAGDFCDHSTRKIFKGSILLIPCYFATVYLEWAPLDSGKGLVKNWGMSLEWQKFAKKVDDFNWVMKDTGNPVVETATYYVLNGNANWKRSFVPLFSTQLGSHRLWATARHDERIVRKDGSAFLAPIYYRAWEASKLEKTNNKGSWYIWKFVAGPKITEIDPSLRLLTEAKEFHEQAKSGLVQGDVETM